MEEFTETVSTLANKAGVVSASTVRGYADSGLLECIRLEGSGTRLFRASDAAKVRELFQARMANRGRHKAA